MKISVVIPTYNRRHTLGVAIDSVLMQVADDFEIIIVDDGSTDGSVGWLRDTYPASGLRVLRNQRAKGPAGARNTGLLAATGELVALLDSDDAFLPGHLADAAAVFAAHPSVGVVFGRAQYEQDGQPVDYMGPNFERKLGLAPKTSVDVGTTLFSDGFFNHLLEFGCWFNLSTVVLRRDAARQLMREELRVAEDYEFWVRLSRGHRFACLHRPQIRYALHADNISFESDASAAQHAPSQVLAYELMLDYPGMTPRQTHLVRGQMAQVLFDWAWRCSRQHQLREALHLHWRSLQLGKRSANAMALLKLPFTALASR